MSGVFGNPRTTGSILIANLPEPDWPVYSWTKDGANAAFNRWEAVENQSVTTITVPSPWDPVRAGTVGMDGCGYLGLVLGLDGKMYSAPWEESDNILVIDPVANTATGVSFGVTQARYGLIYNSNNYLTGAVAPNGKIYFPPFNTGNGVLVIDPATQTSYNIPQSYTQQHYGTAILGSNGLIYCIGRQDCLIIDPRNDTLYTTTFGGVIPTYNTSTPAIGGRWMSAVKCLADDKLYFAPRSADYLIVIDTSVGFYGTAERRNFNSYAMSIGQQYNGIANYQDGKLILTPNGSTSPAIQPPNGQRYWTVIDPLANSSIDINISAISSPNVGISSWGATSGDDGGVYSAPFTGTAANATINYIYTRNGANILSSNFNLSFSPMPLDPEWYGGCMAPNGKIYSLPHMRYYGPSDPTHNNIYAKAILVLEPGGNAIESIGEQNFRTLIDTSYFNKGGS